MRKNHGTTPDKLDHTSSLFVRHASVHLRRNNMEPVLEWLNATKEDSSSLVPRLRNALWQVAVNSGDARKIHRWLKKNKPQECSLYVEVAKNPANTTIFLRSPRSWAALREIDAIPLLTIEQAKKVVLEWGKDADKNYRSASFRHPGSNYKERLSYTESLQAATLSFIEHYMQHPLERMEALQSGISTGAWSMLSTNKQVEGLFQWRGREAASSHLRDLYLLAAMSVKSVTAPLLVFSMLQQGSWSNQWKPLVEDYLTAHYDKKRIEQSSSLVKFKDSMLDKNIAVALQLFSESFLSQQCLPRETAAKMLDMVMSATHYTFDSTFILPEMEQQL